ncbi:hypothetical protein NC651_018360 [Populus alba x Populus x berolinensis]|nr:hypothetical protein NC651_018360 [Populus alba x Populus x berolinensis]
MMGSPELIAVQICPVSLLSVNTVIIGTTMQPEMIYRSGGSSPLPIPYGRSKLQGHLSRLTLTSRIERICGLEVNWNLSKSALKKRQGPFH